jgi:hypothetical protein
VLAVFTDGEEQYYLQYLRILTAAVLAKTGEERPVGGIERIFDRLRSAELSRWLGLAQRLRASAMAMARLDGRR